MSTIIPTPLLMNFHKPHAQDTDFVHQPPHSFPYFAPMTLLQRASFSTPYRHNHFANKAELNLFKQRMPNPPFFTGLQTLDQFTKWNLQSSLIPVQRKSLCKLSIILATLTRIGRRERKYVGKLERVLLIRVTLPPLDKYNFFQPASLRSIFSKIGFQIVLSLKVAPNGRPKYFSGRADSLQPKISTNSCRLGTAPTGTNSDFPKLIFSPNISSNLERIPRSTVNNNVILCLQLKMTVHSQFRYQ